MASAAPCFQQTYTFSTVSTHSSSLMPVLFKKDHFFPQCHPVWTTQRRTVAYRSYLALAGFFYMPVRTERRCLGGRQKLIPSCWQPTSLQSEAGQIYRVVYEEKEPITMLLGTPTDSHTMSHCLGYCTHFFQKSPNLWLKHPFKEVIHLPGVLH